MATLEYKLEYFKGALGSNDDGVFIQLRTDLPVYQEAITREGYYSAGVNQTDFVTALFAIYGVVRISAQAWRLYVEKSPVFQWNEVLPPILEVVKTFTGCTGIHEMPGSGQTLISIKDRRSL